MVLRVSGWLGGCLFFCVDVVDGALQCSVSQVISGDVDGIIHRHSLLLGGVRVLVLLVLKERCTPLETKKLNKNAQRVEND